MTYREERGSIPVNIDPTAPSFENMLVPAPVVFSPTEGYISQSISPSFDAWKG